MGGKKAVQTGNQTAVSTVNAMVERTVARWVETKEQILVEPSAAW